jgi:isoamylase
MRAQVVRDLRLGGRPPLHIPLNAAVIYEMHVGGFTRHPSSGRRPPRHLRRGDREDPLSAGPGITHVELMPVMAFDPQDVPPKTAAMGLENYWGYSTHSFFAPHPASRSIRRARDEFRDLVKALHRAGIGVILDVVFNHTAEGGVGGPTISFKGIGNEVFYHLDFTDRRIYRDYTGCGNTVNCNHPMVTRFLIDCLLYWVRQMHVDGFRFDLASALARGEDGNPQYHAPILWAIELSPLLGRSHIIAEAWDAAGLYQVGDFPGFRWAEWNGRYRDVIRSFVRGDPGLIAEVATRCRLSDCTSPADGCRATRSTSSPATTASPLGPGELQPQAQRGQRRGQPRRPQPQPELELRGRGPDGRSRDPGPASTPGPQLHRHPDAEPGRAHAALRRRGAAQQAGQQQQLLPEQRDLLVRLDPARGQLRDARLRPGYDRLSPPPPDPASQPFLTGAPTAADLPDITWHGVGLDTPEWDDPAAQSGWPSRSPGHPEEPPLHVMLNMGEGSLEFAVPDRRLVLAGRSTPNPRSWTAPIRACRPDCDPVAERSLMVLEGRAA